MASYAHAEVLRRSIVSVLVDFCHYPQWENALRCGAHGGGRDLVRMGGLQDFPRKKDSK